jgi:hypothetical protein
MRLPSLNEAVAKPNHIFLKKTTAILKRRHALVAFLVGVGDTPDRK